MPVEQGRLNRWLNGKDARRGLVYRTLKHANVNINYIHEVADLKWGLIVSLPDPLADMFATRREILIWGFIL
jgi:hypothetical protein